MVALVKRMQPERVAMNQHVKVSADGRVDIDQDDATFHFKVIRNETTRLRLLDVAWHDERYRHDRFERLIQAQATARWWAEREGLVNEGELTMVV